MCITKVKSCIDPHFITIAVGFAIFLLCLSPETVFAQTDPDGTPCFSDGQCLSGHCVDGVCCDNSCDSVCYACIEAYTGQPDGTCSPIMAGQDPDDECAGSELCDGAGSCTTPSAVSTMPVVVVLAQNYPNPFNPRTTIQFGLAKPGLVSLKIFDISGRLIRTLISGIHHEAGLQVAIWDGKDGGDRQVGSGLYLYQLQVNEQVRTKLMILLE